MLPQVDPEQPLPLTLQVTAVLKVLRTVAVNCWVLPATTSSEVGDTDTETGGRMVTEADADLVESATEVAVTVTWAGLGTDPGAVKRPEDETVPQEDPEQPLPVTLQVTAVLVVLRTVAVNCWVFAATTCAEVGEMETETGGRMVTVADADLVVS